MLDWLSPQADPVRPEVKSMLAGSGGEHCAALRRCITDEANRGHSKELQQHYPFDLTQLLTDPASCNPSLLLSPGSSCPSHPTESVGDSSSHREAARSLRPASRRHPSDHPDRNPRCSWTSSWPHYRMRESPNPPASSSF